MKLKGHDLHRFDLYLSEELDARLIAHLEKFTANRRTNQELRRMLYAALDGSTARVTLPPIATGPAYDSRTSESTMFIETAPEVTQGVRGKLKKAFGGFG